MLRIGDIHITSKWSDILIETLQEFVDQYPTEKTIIFFGDYVYHFNYDRKALLSLFGFFVSLYKQGKSVYVLAGNHDRIADNFVYEEAKQAFDIVGKHQQGCLKFVTEPEIISLEGQDCLFFPYHIPQQERFVTKHFETLLHSSHPKERLSGKANSMLYDMIRAWEQHHQGDKTLFVFHHRYLANTQFPGQWARFSYKSPALDPVFLSWNNIRLVSGHLHHAFSLKNYLCLGSIRNTSPLETNQQKYLFHYDVSNDVVTAHACTINPYITKEIDTSSVLSLSGFLAYIQSQGKENQQVLSAGNRTMKYQADTKAFPLSRTHLSCIGDDLSYEALDQYIDSELMKNLGHITIKRKKQALHMLWDDLQEASGNLNTSIQDRKTLLLKYLDLKYKKNAGGYVQLLKEINIL